MTRESWVLWACIAASGLVGFDVGMVPVALPQIQSDLGADLAGQLWIGSGFLLTLGTFLLVGGALGDALNRWRVFLGGVLLFGVACIVSGLAINTTMLIAGRMLQGVAAAFYVPAVLASMRATFEGEALSEALGRWTAWTSLLAIAGPPIAGLMIDFISWRAVFLLEVVLAGVVGYMIWQATPDKTESVPRRIDWAGALLLALGVGGVLYALIEGPVRGWTSAPVAGALMIGLALFAAFLGWEARAAAPLLPLRLFKNRAFSGINLTTFLLYAVFGATGYIITLFLIQVSGYSPFVAGFAVAPTFLVLFFGEEIANNYVSHLPPRLAILTGIAVCVVANFLYFNIEAGASYFTAVLPGAALYGVGLVFVISPLTKIALSSVDEADAGVASGVNNALARISSAIGLALLGIVLTGVFTSSAAAQLEDSGLHEAFTVADLRNHVFGSPSLDAVPEAERAAAEAAFVTASEDALHAAVVFFGVFVIAGGVACYLVVPSVRTAPEAITPETLMEEA